MRNRFRFLIALVATTPMGTAAPPRADFDAGCRAAWTLRNTGDEESALAAFQALAAAADNDWQRSDALEEAVVSARQLGRKAEATALAKRIPLAPRAGAVQMRLLAADGQWADIVGQFGEVDLGAWPRRSAAEALHWRGKALAELQQPEAALPDLIAAARRGTDAAIFFDLATVAFALGDEECAMDAWRDTLRAHEGARHIGGWMFLGSIENRAGALSRRGLHAAALAELQRAGIENLNGSWLIQMLCARATALAGLGRRAEARADAERAIATEGVDPWQRAALEKILAGLE